MLHVSAKVITLLRKDIAEETQITRSLVYALIKSQIDTLVILVNNTIQATNLFGFFRIDYRSLRLGKHYVVI